jgi:hypothetical protein
MAWSVNILFLTKEIADYRVAAGGDVHFALAWFDPDTTLPLPPIADLLGVSTLLLAPLLVRLLFWDLSAHCTWTKSTEASYLVSSAVFFLLVAFLVTDETIATLRMRTAAGSGSCRSLFASRACPSRSTASLLS